MVFLNPVGMIQHQEIRVRLAGTRDRRAFSEIDPRISADLGRRETVDAAIAARTCWIAERNSKPLGYGILSRKFFSRDFVELLYVAEDERRKGVGAAILATIENTVMNDRVFTSTNESNAPMRALLEQCGYQPSGTIDNLDPGDPELVFVKFRPKKSRIAVR
jgi:GNAT superfamily N-acetyltransferase